MVSSPLRYSEGEIRFNLMAIVSDRKMIYERKIAELQMQLTEVSGSTTAEFYFSHMKRLTCLFSKDNTYAVNVKCGSLLCLGLHSFCRVSIHQTLHDMSGISSMNSRALVKGGDVVSGRSLKSLSHTCTTQRHFPLSREHHGGTLQKWEVIFRTRRIELRCHRRISKGQIYLQEYSRMYSTV